MPSSGTGSDISGQEANDLLHRLITESIKVQSVFNGRGGVAATVPGFVSCPTTDVVLVTEGGNVAAPSLSFGLKDVVKFKYGDDRAFPSRDIPGAPRRVSALIFVYPDDTQVGLFEIADKS